MILYGVITSFDRFGEQTRKVLVDITSSPHLINLWETDKNVLIDALVQKAVRGVDAFNEVLEFSQASEFKPEEDLLYYNNLVCGCIKWEGPNRAHAQDEGWNGGFGLTKEDAMQMYVTSCPKVDDGEW